MRIPSVLCLMTMLANSANAQSSTLEPIHVSPGTVLTFHLQARLNAGAGNEVDRNRSRGCSKVPWWIRSVIFG
jgi:hypothetical protein